MNKVLVIMVSFLVVYQLTKNSARFTLMHASGQGVVHHWRFFAQDRGGPRGNTWSDGPWEEKGLK